MSFVEVRQALVRDFVSCVDHQKLPPLSGYVAEYVKSGAEIVPDEFRLLPLTAPALRFANTSSDCLTDCILDLQSQYQQYIPDDWGGRMERGSRDIGVLGFDINPGVVLDIRELNPTSSHVAWAKPKLEALFWERLLIRAVIEFGRCCGAKQVTLLPAQRCPVEAEVRADPVKLAEHLQELRQRYDASATAMGFSFDHSRDCFVLQLAANP